MADKASTILSYLKDPNSRFGPYTYKSVNEEIVIQWLPDQKPPRGWIDIENPKGVKGSSGFRELMRRTLPELDALSEIPAKWEWNPDDLKKGRIYQYLGPKLKGSFKANSKMPNNASIWDTTPRTKATLMSIKKQPLANKQPAREFVSRKLIGALDRVSGSEGFADLDEIKASENPRIVQAYELRRKKLADLQAKLKKAKQDKIDGITREIKLVTITDPTVMFQFTGNKRNSITAGGERLSGWSYFNEDSWKTFDAEEVRNPLKKGLKTLEAHHDLPVDKYYKYFKGLSDSELFFRHLEGAKRGHFFGNHLFNRTFIDQSRHQGRTRQGTRDFESIHGMIKHADLTTEQFEDIIELIDTNPFADISDVGSPVNPDALTKRSVLATGLPYTEQGPLKKGERFVDSQDLSFIDDDTLFGMADNDKAALDKLMDQPVKTELLFEGKAKTKYLKTFLGNNRDLTNAPPEILEAIKNQDMDVLLEYDKIVNPKYSLNETLELMKAGKIGAGTKKPFLNPNRLTVPQLEAMIGKTTGKLRKAGALGELGMGIATGNPIQTALAGGTLGMQEALKNPTVQKKLAQQIAELTAKRGATTAAKLIPGLDVVLSGGEALGYLSMGRLDQAGIAALSGAIGWVPLIGDGASAALDLTNTGLDIARLQYQQVNPEVEGSKINQVDYDPNTRFIRGSQEALKQAARAF